MTEEGASQRPRYVWDKEKLSWVEATGRPAAEDVVEQAVEKVADLTAEDELYEGIPAEIGPEYVEAEALQYRGIWTRVIGVLIDFLILGAVSLALNAILNSFDISIGRWLVSSIGVFYFIGFWTWRGQSLGKMAIGAKIVKLDGSPVGIWRAILRYIGYWVYINLMQASITYISWILVIVIVVVVILVPALNRKKRGLHDFLAGTVVVNSRPSPLEEYEDYEEAIEEDEWAEELEEE